MKYTVVVKKEYFASIVVEADSEDEAGDRAIKELHAQVPSHIGPFRDEGNSLEVDCIYDGA